MTATSSGRSLELYFIDGRPDGMQTAEVFNWTGHVLMTPRTQIAAALKRKEAEFAGVYLLIGENEDGPLAYIGESENIAQRIKSHDQQKDWWTRAILVTTGANNLNKAHIRYLEARLVQAANDVKRVRLENGNIPGGAGLSEAAEANMGAFLEYLLMVLPALRIDMFIKNAVTPGKEPVPSGAPGEAAFVLVTKKHSLEARAKLVNGAFIVEAGSQARLHWEGREKSNSSYRGLHEELKASGVLEAIGDYCKFSKSYAFSSTSAAAAVVIGRSARGTVEWKHADSGQTYKQWEAAQLNIGEVASE